MANKRVIEHIFTPATRSHVISTVGTYPSAKATKLAYDLNQRVGDKDAEPGGIIRSFEAVPAN